MLDELRRRLREARANKDRSMFVVAGSGVSIPGDRPVHRQPLGPGCLAWESSAASSRRSSWKKRRFDAAAVEAKLATRRVSRLHRPPRRVIESTLRGAGGSSLLALARRDRR